MIIHRKLCVNWGCNTRVDCLDEEVLGWMSDSGCFLLALGIESGNQEILDKINKGITLDKIRSGIALCKKYKMKLSTYFIIGFPWDNRETVNNTVKFARELKSDFTEFIVPYPLAGTEFYDIARQHNLFKEDELLSKGIFIRSCIHTFSLSRDELTKLRNNALLKVYFNPAYIFMMLGKMESLSMVGNYMLRGLQKIWYIIKHNLQKSC